MKEYRVTFEEVNTRNPIQRTVTVQTKSKLDAKKIVYANFGGMKKIKVINVEEYHGGFFAIPEQQGGR